MKASWLFLALLLVAGSTAAQMYKWVDKDGKVRYGDTPPTGAKATLVTPPSGSTAGAAPAAASKDANDAKKKGPPTPAEQEQEYRQRQAEARKDADEADAAQRTKSERNEACERTREYLRTLESGQRVARTNPSGERYYLDDSAVAREIAKAQQSAQRACK